MYFYTHVIINQDMSLGLAYAFFALNHRHYCHKNVAPPPPCVNPSPIVDYVSMGEDKLLVDDTGNAKQTNRSVHSLREVGVMPTNVYHKCIV